MPKTNLGKWSLGLIPAMFILFFIGSSLSNTYYDSVSAGNTILEDLIRRPYLAGSMLLGFSAGITAFITGLVSIIKQKDRGVLVFVSTAIGAILIVFLICELVSPH